MEVREFTPRIQLAPGPRLRGRRGGAPEYLAHEPPHVPRPLQEASLVIAGDGVHGEYDHLGTLALRLHCVSSMSFV